MCFITGNIRPGVISTIFLFFLLTGTAQGGLDAPHNETAPAAVGCLSCHHMTSSYPKLLPPLGRTPQDQDDTLANNLCWSCHNDGAATYVKTHSSLQTDNGYGSWTVECWVCHNQHSQEQDNYNGSTHGKYIRRSINLANIKGGDGNTLGKTGIKSVIFKGRTGLNSFADGNGTYDGICEVCHTRTTHFRNDGSGSDQLHTNINGGQAGVNCITCHNHTNSFVHGNGSAGSANCSDLSCHGGTGAHAGHLNDAGLECGACHDLGNMPNFSDGGTSKDSTGVCADCHHDGTVIATGVNVPVNPPDWDSGLTLDCAGCHGNGPGYANSTPKANSHPAHAGYTCDVCHAATTTTGNSITTPANHTDAAYTLQADGSVSFTYSFNAAGSTCAAISCHGNSDATWGDPSSAGCSTCHTTVQGSRVAVMSQFAGNSHHIQGVAVESTHCYQCHWEANPDGSINSAYHGGSGAPGSSVNLVIYGAGARPLAYTPGTTAIEYTANGLRNEQQKINGHCLGCHRDQNNGTEPFGDGKTPRQYAWDSESIDAKYSSLSTTPWGKYSGNNKNSRTKAFSAHGKAESNQGGWDTSETWTNSRNGSTNVLCFDCHNSHGSSVPGLTTNYTSATTNGGIFKDTTAGNGGYSVTYKPAAGGSDLDKNAYNAGAGLCFDCHQTADGGTAKPWGYNSTFGATQQILGYFDTPYFGPGVPGVSTRYTYKGVKSNKGGHFGKSDDLQSPPDAGHQINGLCTPCHDPHGVSPTLGTDAQYAVPMLKGTWITDPYKEDRAPANNQAGTTRTNRGKEGVGYNIGSSSFVMHPDAQFAGLCLNCHAKADLTDGADGGSWKSVDRIHESVKGWKTGAANHNYTCSKCHTPHNSTLPRLMVTNCLNTTHKGRLGYNSSAVLNSSGSGTGYKTGTPPTCWGESATLGDCRTHWSSASNGSHSGTGSGRIPGRFSYSRGYGGSYSNLIFCHENATGNSTNQSWNSVTQWLDSTPVIISGPQAAFSAVGSNVQATITWTTAGNPATSYVDYGATSAYGLTTGSATLVNSHSVTLQNLTNHSTYHYRVRSQSALGNQTASGDKTFAISVPPTVPTLVDQPNIQCTAACNITLEWSGSSDPDNGPVQYEVEVDSSSSFDTGNKQTSPWISAPATTWTQTLATDTTWYARVRARDANHSEAVSTWSSLDTFTISTNIAAPTLIAEGGYSGGDCSGNIPVTLEWSAVSGAAEYYVEVYYADYNGGSSLWLQTSSGWIPGTSWVFSAWNEIDGWWMWRVKARDGAGVESAWSAWDYFTDDDACYCGSTCPMIYTWDGEKFVFEIDLFGTGKLGVIDADGYVQPNPKDFYLLATEPARGEDGNYELRMVEERNEVDYLDEVKLYAIDMPQDRDVYTELSSAGGTGAVKPEMLLHTVDQNLNRPASAIHVNTGEDISGLTAASDEQYLVLGTSRSRFEWHTVEIDFGDISDAPMLKLIIDGITAFPSTTSELARLYELSSAPERTRLEVLDEDGNWVAVPRDKVIVPKPQEFRRPYVVVLTDIFLTNTYKIRLSFLYKTYIDSLLFDTTADEPVTIHEVLLDSATLGYYGASALTGSGDLSEFIYGVKQDKDFIYMPGAYTKYGDIKPLLTDTDDKFAIFGGGDEVRLKFSEPAAGPEGSARRFVVYAHGYYKDFKSDAAIERTVEPLPFNGMSNFPYDPAVENYPTDDDHNQYRSEYNIRSR